MIIQSLVKYYSRLTSESAPNLPPFGFSREKIHYALVLDTEGRLVQAPKKLSEDKKGMELIVPRAVKRSSNVAANFLWDKTDYVLGAAKKDNLERLCKCHAEFIKIFDSVLCDIYEEDAGLRAIKLFLNSWQADFVGAWPEWSEIAGKNLVFQLDGRTEWIHQTPLAIKAWGAAFERRSDSNPVAFCLDSGQRERAEILHGDIKGGWKDQSDAAIASFNLNAFESYGHEQCLNAPMSTSGEFAYVTALNYLLRWGSRQRIQIGDATTVFWTDRDSPIEGMFGQVLNPIDKDVPALRILLDSARKGDPLPDDIDARVRFYVLGLSPNVSRLAVRFWYMSDVGQLMAKIGRHYAALQIDKPFDNDFEFIPVWRLLQVTAVREKSDNVQPLLAGALVRSILEGTRYPETLLAVVLERIRAEQAEKDKKGKPVPNVSYARAALIKALLIRNHNREVSMSLDKSNDDPGYCCGRLFGVLELIQEKAQPGINSTIRDRFYGGASSTPRTVFPNLMGLKNHHLAKMQEKGLVYFYEGLLGEIVDKLGSQFPAHLNLVQQGSFAIGYYHQRQNIFKGKEKKEEVLA